MSGRKHDQIYENTDNISFGIVVLISDNIKTETEVNNSLIFEVVK
jgi:hypothetical protein